MKRSGSTWLANVVRIIYEVQGKKVWFGREVEGKEKAGYDVTISKIHEFVEGCADIAKFVLTSSRPMEDVRESFKRFKGQYPSETQMRDWPIWLERWRKHPKHIVNIEFDACLPSGFTRAVTVLHIIVKLDIDISASKLDSAYRRIESEIVPPTDKDYDPKTLLFKNHITKKLDGN